MSAPLAHVFIPEIGIPSVPTNRKVTFSSDLALRSSAPLTGDKLSSPQPDISLLALDRVQPTPFTNTDHEFNEQQLNNPLNERPKPVERSLTAPPLLLIKDEPNSNLKTPPPSKPIKPQPPRPQLHRFYSLPMNPRSPSRQHFRLYTPTPHQVKETQSLGIVEDGLGTTFANQYEITKVLGKGSFGMVYLARDPQGHQYALKECSKQRLARLNRASVMRLRRRMLINSMNTNINTSVDGIDSINARNANNASNANVPNAGITTSQSASINSSVNTNSSAANSSINSNTSVSTSSSSNISISITHPNNPHTSLPSPPDHPSQAHLSPHSPPTDDFIHREIAIMKKLDHPNLVSLYEVLDSPVSESLVLVIEFCAQGCIMPAEEDYDGNATPIPLDQARLYFRDLILGVEYLHSRGVCHRDIKADNVLLSDEDVVKLADFGVSEIFERSGNSDDACDDVMKRPVGSPAYMSPELVLLRATPNMTREQLRVHPSNTPVSGRKADIWAMGVTLYYMVHGRLPFEAKNICELNTAILTQQPDLSQCPIDLADLFARIFDKNPHTRCTLDELRNHAWITQGGADPLLSKEENCEVLERDIVTEDDIRDAIALLSHRKGSESMLLNYLDVSKSLRTNYGWKGDGTSRSITPVSSNSANSSFVESDLKHDSVKMEKLSVALEELLSMKDWSMGEHVSEVNM